MLELDNLCSSYQCLRALIDSTDDAALAERDNISMAMLFDHEEVGSSSCTGAGSSLFMDTLRLIHAQLTDGSTSESKIDFTKNTFCDYGYHFVGLFLRS